MTHAVCLVPARMSSSRFPGKPLVDIDGVPLVVRSARRALLAGCFDRVVVATEDEIVVAACRAHGLEVVLTPVAETGSDRVAFAAAAFSDDTVVVNLQGDEPVFPTEPLAAIARAVPTRPEAFWTAAEFDDLGPTELQERDRVKIRLGVPVEGSQENGPNARSRSAGPQSALPPPSDHLSRPLGVATQATPPDSTGAPDAMSAPSVHPSRPLAHASPDATRTPVVHPPSPPDALRSAPHLIARDFHRLVPADEVHFAWATHVGVYAATARVFREFASLPPSRRERERAIEPLRWLDAGREIRVVGGRFDRIAVDRPEDIDRVQAFLQRGRLTA